MTARIGVCDYGVGNVRSVERALRAAGAEAVINDDPMTLERCDGLLLPGVGAFSPAMQRLRESGMAAVAKGFASEGRPLLAVCLGYQMLFEHSDEGDGSGLALLTGDVTRIASDNIKVPHIGWNTLRLARRSPLFDGIDDGAYVYFVHSYTATGVDDIDVIATVDYGGPLVAAVQRGSVTGTQFHPEKSGRDGLRLYANFVAIAAASRTAAVWH